MNSLKSSTNMIIKAYKPYFSDYILNNYYKFDKERNIYLSSLSSIYECLLKKSNYKFPEFLNSLNNEFEFNYVITDMIKKHARESMKIHARLTEKYPGYTFHSLSPDEMEIIVGEVYQMYLIVQNFFDNLSKEEKNYINIVENVYLEASEDMNKNNRYFLSRVIYNKSNHYYIDKYNNQPPIINFDRLYK